MRSPAALLSALEPDKFYSYDNATRRFRLAGIADAAAMLSEARAAGWVEDYPERNELILPAKCYLPTRQAAALPIETGPFFSYFRGPISNTLPCQMIGPAQLHQVITGPVFAEKTAALRQLVPSSEARKKLKNGLDYVTPGGTFAKRGAENLLTYSGLLVLDFDHLPDVGAARAALLADSAVGPSVALLFTSPSGDGLKCLMRYSVDWNYTGTLQQVAGYLRARYPDLGLKADPSGKDIARACFICHDPNAYLNPLLRPSFYSLP